MELNLSAEAHLHLPLLLLGDRLTNCEYCETRTAHLQIEQKAQNMASAASSLRAAGGNERFNKEAAAWDANPFVHEMSQAAFQALREYIPAMASEASSKKLDVLEIGCGTGLLTMPVAGVVRQVVAVDAAQGMIDVLQRKVKQAGVENVIPLAVLLEDPEDTSLPPSNDNEGRLKFDLVTSHLVLHVGRIAREAVRYANIDSTFPSYNQY